MIRAAGAFALVAALAAVPASATTRHTATAKSSAISTSSGSKGSGTSGGASPTGSQAASGNCCQHLGQRTLEEGMDGHDVRVLQDFLTRDGFRTPITGHFGARTKKNVIAFQHSQHIQADGIVTPAVAQRLRHVAAAKDAPVGTTRINGNGTATPPSNAPNTVREVVAAANKIIHTSYCYAGGHGQWNDSCYDCSGSVSYALHGGHLLSSPEDSTELESFGSPGRGRWITIYANANHTWIVVAGRAFDTADYGGPDIPGGSGPRWRSDPTGNLQDGQSYVVRHPTGL